MWIEKPSMEDKITIFWLAWSGTSTVWKLLAEKLGYEFMSSWNIMRSWWEELWLSIYDFENQVVANDWNFDLKLDTKVEDYWKEYKKFIFESRLAWYFIPDSFKIFLECEKEERYKRIQKRESQSYNEIKEKNEKRESDLIVRYGEVYPHITFPPEKDQFDLVIDTIKFSPSEVVNLILQNVKPWKYI